MRTICKERTDIAIGTHYKISHRLCSLTFSRFRYGYQCDFYSHINSNLISTTVASFNECQPICNIYAT